MKHCFIIPATLLCLFAAGCGTQVEKYQGQTSRDDVENMGLNNEVTMEDENPRSVNKVGHTWGLKQDREMAKTAAQQLEGVTVKRVIMESDQIWVTVDVAGEDEMSDEERDEWKEQIGQAVYKAVPRYDIHVKIK